MSNGQKTDRKVLEIALPDRIPNPPQLPTDPHSLHSGTVESLLIQNDDLTARLAVSHRRNSEMERRVRELACEYSELQKRMEVLGDQILIYREKDKVTRDRHSALEQTIEQLRSQLELQNMRYSELYNNSQLTTGNFREQNEKLGKQVRVLQRYRDRILTQIAPLVREQKVKLAEQKNTIGQLHRHLGESGEFIKHQKVEFDTFKFESEQKTRNLEAELSQLRPIQEKYLRLKEERTIHQNRVIAAERTRDELLEKHRAEVHRLQEESMQYRAEAKSLRIELQNQTERRDEADKTLAATREENLKLRDQSESVKALWLDLSRKFEAARKKEVEHEKLSFELSQSLIQSKQEADASEKNLKQEMQNLHATIKLLSTELDLLKSTPTAPAEKSENLPEGPSRLEHLLHNIRENQAFLAGQLKGHSFIENETNEDCSVDSEDHENDEMVYLKQKQPLIEADQDNSK